MWCELDSHLEELVGIGCAVVVLLLLLVVVISLVARRHYKDRRQADGARGAGPVTSRPAEAGPELAPAVIDNWSIPRPQPRVWQTSASMLSAGIEFIIGLNINTVKRGSVAEWLACWTQAQKGLGSNRSRDAVG